MNFLPTICNCQNCADEFGQNHLPIQTLIPADCFVPPDEQPDYYEACLSYIHDILMEEEDEDYTCNRLSDFGALQATEKSFYDALGHSNRPSSSDQLRPQNPENESFATRNPVESNTWALYQPQIEPFACISDTSNYLLESDSRPFGYLGSLDETDNVGGFSLFDQRNDLTVNQGGGSKKIQRDDDDDDGDCQDLTSNKHLASCNDDDCEEIQRYDNILLPKNERDDVTASEKAGQDETQCTKKSTRRKSHGKKRNDNTREVVDLRTLLTQCAQAVSSFDVKIANNLLRQIRDHSTPHGDCIQRVAHYFANGLEARMAGTGSQLYFHFINSRVPPSGVLKAYQCYATAVPIFRTSFYFANQMIASLAERATQIHVIDFGIYHGFQWPSLIQHLSERPTGPPKLRITGIEYPLNGFRPAEKVEQTGRRLKAYCERFKVPFEYQAIAKSWETIQQEDIRIERGELVVVNCQYRSSTLLDETVEMEYCPRDAFLRLIRDLNPDLFVHGIVNSSYGAPFFTTRFREALFNFMSMFDIYEATMPRENHERMLIEQELHGSEILNITASEGVERVSRPETYKRWQVRTLRAGFTEYPIDSDLISRAKEIVKVNYHKDFVVDQDGHWMLQGWKGRILFAISCWKPAEIRDL